MRVKRKQNTGGERISTNCNTVENCYIRAMVLPIAISLLRCFLGKGAYGEPWLSCFLNLGPEEVYLCDTKPQLALKMCLLDFQLQGV
jgi:hypothetical protein